MRFYVVQRAFHAHFRRALAASVAGMAISAAQPLFAQSLDEASSWALRASLSIAADNARQDAANARLRAAYDAFMPTVAIVGEKILSSSISYDPQQAISGYDSTIYHQPDAIGVHLSLPVFDGFKRYNSLQAARANASAGRFLQAAARQQVRLDTAVAYLSVLRDERIVDLRNRQVADAAAITRMVAAKTALHDMTIGDQALASSRGDAARAARDQARTQLEASVIEFRRLTGGDPAHLTAPSLADLAIPSDAHEFETELLRANPRLQAGRLEVEAARRSADAAKAQMLPQANLVASVSEQRNVSALVQRQRDATVKLQVRIPLFEPGAFPQAQEASALARQKDYEYRDSEKKAVSDALALLNAYRSMSGQSAMVGKRVANLQRVIASYRIEQGIGVRTIVDVLNARAELTDAMIQKVTLECDRSRQGMTLVAALGRL